MLGLSCRRPMVSLASHLKRQPSPTLKWMERRFFALLCDVCHNLLRRHWKRLVYLLPVLIGCCSIKWVSLYRWIYFDRKHQSNWPAILQANQRIIDAAASRLDIPSDKVISNLANYGNTSAASIPLALDEAVRAGKVKAGDVIAASGFGAGLTWGSAIVKWC